VKGSLLSEPELLTIACDESASEGENLMGSKHPVFVHASVNITTDAASEFMATLRAATKTQARELKSKIALAPRNRAALLEVLGSLDNQGNILLVDKSYFVAAKMIDLLVDELAHEYGVEVGLSGLGRQLADYLHQRGATAIGVTRWHTLLNSYNSVIRSYYRADAAPPTVEVFFEALEDALRNCCDVHVAQILGDIWRAREFTREYEGASPSVLRELDPMAPSITAASMTWQMRIGEVPFEFLADNYSGLSEEVCKAIVEAARAPLSVGGVELPRADLRAVRLVDSKFDVRVQVADILAGVGREVALLAANGVIDDQLQTVVHEMLDFNVLASSGSAIDRLVESRPLRYVEEWSARLGSM